jgi:hypothetical protein
LARICPSDITKLALGGAHSPEVETLALLQKSLPNDYTVFHGVHWSREYSHHTVYGEIDFVVVNRAGDVLLIEQKNGALEESDGQLIKKYGDGKSSNPVEQLHRSIARIREKFSWQNGKDLRLDVDYLVYCPEHRVRNLSAPGIDATRIVDADTKDQLPGRIDSLLGTGGTGDPRMATLVEEFFAQSFDLLPAVSSFVEAGQRNYARHSGLAVEILESLSMNPFRLRVRGAAGCGKSLMAQRMFRRAVSQGKRPLLVCFNHPLAERMKSLLDGGYVDTWHGLCTKFLESIGQKPDFTRANADPSFWKQVLDDVLAAEISDEWRFDALIVDEGQDFEADWFEILKTFLTDEASITWLEDPAQNLYSRPALELPGFVAIDIKANYRTPQRIARFIEDTLAPNIRWPNDLPGLGVQVHEYETPADQLKLAGKIVQDLMRLGFRHEDIAIISLRGYKNSVFFEADKVGGLAVRRFSGDYLPDGTQVMTDGQLLYDSIFRFKGQEAPAIILTDVDLGGRDPERARAALFCGMTRPTVRLEILVAANNSSNSFLLDANR